MFETFIPLAIIIVSAIVGFLVRGYFGSYVSEKGKNLATKEDIAQITTEIENVKSSIQTLTQLKTDYEQQRRQWLLAFYDSSIEMLYKKFSVNFGDFPFDEGKSLIDFQKSFNAIIAAMVKEYQRIVLYFESENPLRVHSEKVLNAALEAHSIFKKRFGAVKITFLEEEAAFKSGDQERKNKAVEKSNEANKKYWDEIKPIANSFQGNLQDYLTAVNHFLKENNDTTIL